jgi:hypothetical protein
LHQQPISLFWFAILDSHLAHIAAINITILGHRIFFGIRAIGYGTACYLSKVAFGAPIKQSKNYCEQQHLNRKLHGSNSLLIVNYLKDKLIKG